MGRCCRAEHICGLTEFIEDVVGGGGGGGTPGSPVNSVQYNSAGAFAGSSNLTYDGTSLKVTGQIQFNGTSNLYPMFKASSATTTELQARLADDTDLTEFRSKFLYAGPTTGAVRLSAAGQGIAVLTNNAGSDLSRLCLGGSTSLFPAFKRNGADVHLRLADDSAFANLQLGNLNVATITNGTLTGGSSPALNVTQTWNNAATTFTGALINVTDTASNAASKLLDLQVGGVSQFNVTKAGITTSTAQVVSPYFVTTGANSAGVYIRSNSTPTVSMGTSDDIVLTRDAADVLALRRSSNAELVRVYETYTDSTTFSRGVFGFRDSASGGTGTGSATTVLRIGTEKGSVGGTARAVSIITDGVERMNIGASGTISTTGNFTINSGNLVASGIKTSFSGIFTRNDAQVGFSSTSDPADPTDTAVKRVAANILGITNGSTGPGTLAIDNVQGTNFERLKAEWASNVARIGTSKGGSGTAREFAIITDDTERVKVRADAGSVSITGGTITTSSKPIIDGTQTWNDAGATFTAFKQNVTDTASGVNSLLFDWQVGGTSYLKLTKYGDLVGSAFTGTDFSIRMQNGSLKQGSATQTTWGSANAAGTMDTGLARAGAAIVKFTNASTGPGMMQLEEVAAAPSAPAANNVVIYAVDNGSGKTQLMALFSSGAAQQIAIQP